jgi:hypothetical protein
MAAIGEANRGHVPAYGDDPVTARTIALVQEHLGLGTESAVA